MLRTQVVGCVFFLSICLCAGVHSLLSPTWLITRVELKEQACTTGQGILQGDVQWGDNIPSVGLACGSPGRSSFAQFCTLGSEPLIAGNICSHLHLAAGLSALALGFTGFSLLLAIALSIGFLKKRGLCACLLGAFTSASACLCYGGVFAAMVLSPLFAQEHFDQLSLQSDRPFAGWGCVFQTPLHRPFKRLLTDSTLNCLIGGGAFAAGLTALTSAFLATIAFGLLSWNYKKAHRASSKPLTEEHESLSEELTPSSPSDPITLRLLLSRKYCIYGSCNRKSKHLGRLQHFVYSSLIPLVTLANAAFFAYCNLSPGAMVSVTLSADIPAANEALLHNASRVLPMYDGAGEHRVEITEAVFDFTMLVAIQSFFEGQAYALGILSVLFSLAWPYVKVATWLWVWYVPMGEVLRGRLLTILDHLGKWSFINTFVLCLMTVAFYFYSEIRIPWWVVPFAIKRGRAIVLSVRVSLNPGFATYGYILGCVWSLIIGKLFVFVHVKTKTWEEILREVKLSKQISTQGSQDSASLANAAEDLIKLRAMKKRLIYRPGYGFESLKERLCSPIPGKKHRYSSIGKKLIYLALLVALVLTVIGAKIQSFKFHFAGIVGSTIVSPAQRDRGFSLISCAEALRESGDISVLGGWFVVVVFVLVGVVAPVLYLIVLTIVWFMPMQLETQRRWFNALELLTSCNAFDVLVVSLLSAIMEIKQLSKALLGSSFAGLEGLVDDILPQSGGLLAVEQEFLPGMGCLIFAVVLEKILSHVIVNQFALSISERTEEEEILIKRAIRSESRDFLTSTSTSEEVRLEEEGLSAVPYVRGGETQIPPESLVLFSPAARFVGASGCTGSIYAGLPRFVWRVGILIGLLKEEDPAAYEHSYPEELRPFYQLAGEEED